MAIPSGWSMTQAAALPEVYLTAWVNLYHEAALAPGEVVLVHGGASGVGTAAIQLCAMSGNPIVVTAGSDAKVEACRRLGATHALNYRSGDWAEAVRRITGPAPQGVDVILDMVGADYLAANLALLKTRGRLVFISTLSGGRSEIDIRHLMGRRLRLIGSVLRSRTLEEKVAIRDGFLAQFGAGLADGRISPVIDGVYPITQANEAHGRMADNRNIGKIVLAIR
jgi:NADPH2:quinone reductase